MHCVSGGSGSLARDCSRQGIHQSPFQPLIQVLSYRIPQTHTWYLKISRRYTTLFDISMKPCHIKIPPIFGQEIIQHPGLSFNALHFVILKLETAGPWVWAMTNYFSFIIPRLCTLLSLHLLQLNVSATWNWTNVRNIALLRFKPATDSTSSKSFLCNFGQIWLLINPNWTQCAFQSWNIFLGKYLNYSNITLPNPRGKRILNCPWTFACIWF